MSHIGKNIKKLRTVHKLSQAAFAELFNLARPSVGAYEEGRAEPKIETLISIANHFGLSTDVLLRKELTINELYSFDVLKGEFDPTQMPPALGRSSEEKAAVANIMSRGAAFAQEDRGVPLIGKGVSLEYIVNLHNRDFVANLPRIQLPSKGKRNARAFIQSGNEMYYNGGGIQQGDVVLCESVDTSKLEKVSIDKPYVVVTAKQFFTRRIISANSTAITLKADNPAFENITLNKDDILELWAVEGIWSTRIDPPALIETRILNLESMLEQLNKKVEELERKHNEER